MLGKSPNRNERDMFRPLLSEFIDMNNDLVRLSEKIDWSYFEKEFAPLYSKVGQPSEPIRLMVGCLMLQHLYDYGDETLPKAWECNPYMQYFCGEAYFQHHFPCDPSNFSHFRKRIGVEGVNKIFQYSVSLFGKEAEEDLMVSDTTVQGNNTEFPTDAGLYKKVIDSCNKIAKSEGITQRQSYTRRSKALLRICYNARNPKRRKNASVAKRKLHTLAGRQVRELLRKLSDEAKEKYAERLTVFVRILNQTRTSKDKVYSPHKPYTACIAKGKASHEYEFGNKVGIVCTAKRQIIVAIKAFMGNPNDSKTIEPLIEQMETNGRKLPKQIAYDRGGRGQKEIHGVEILTPGKPLKKDTPYQKAKKRKPFRRRAAIEPLIGHLKKDHRMQDNFLWGSASSTVNAMLAATAWNLKKFMKELLQSIFALLRTLINYSIELKSITLQPILIKKESY